MIVAVLATIKAGGAYVPLDPGYPADRLAFILEDARPPVVVVHEHTIDQLPPHEATVLDMDSEARSLAAEPATLPESASEPSDLAYVIYTSGSTGMPKGVEVEHRHVARLFSSTDEWFGFGPGDTWALLHSYAFDFSVWEMWGALLHGGKLVVPSRMTIRSPEALAILLVLERVTVLNATPSLFSGLMGHLLGVADRMSLRTVVFGGEELRPTALAPWFDRFGSDGPALVNMYGITETTVHVTYKPLGPESAQAAGSPIGRPLPDLEIHLLDPAGRHVPRGVAGEIFVGGAGVARGYLNRPELTAERFVPNPFGSGRLYRSGDRARQLRDGGLDYLGRGDEQVKVRGFRIELGEIERALAEHPAVSEAAVTAVEVAPGDTRLAAYLVPVNGSAGLDDLPAALQAHAKRKLPPHMVPASVGVVERLPLTTNGKLNRAALPAPTWGTAKASVAPRTLLEQQLAQLWREILDVGQVGADDGFFELGGHSLLAVRLFAEIEQRFGVRLPLATLFHGDTLAELAATIAAEQAASRPWSPIVPLRAEGSRPPLIVISLGNLNSDFLPYRQLVAQLGDDQPVYGLQSPGMDGRTLPLGTVEELAAHYVRELRTFQPGGPHLLLGLAFAGMVAYETARQLIEAGEPVVLLAMLHSAPYGRKSEPPLHGADPRTWGPWIRNRGHNLHHKLGLAYYDHLVRKGRKRPRRSPWDLHLMASSRARQTYVAPPSDARIDFFGVASERHERYAARWEPLARGGLEYHAVVGTEDDTWRLVYLTRPHVDRIAEALRRVMDTRLEEWTGSS
jgi:nonribosomal peptide synthetase DhbF